MQQHLPILLLIIFILVTVVLYKLQPYSFPSLHLQIARNCSRSWLESDHFICESDELWNERKALYQIQDELNMKKLSSSPFFLKNWEPNFHCSHARRIGRMGDGGKWVCDLFRLRARSNCLVYSAGSSGDFSFEEEMKHYLPNCEIHTFDTGLYQCPMNVCVFHQAMLGNGKSPNTSKTWQMIVEELGHKDRAIDVLKIDIESGEFNFFPTIFPPSNCSHPRQILVEIHPPATAEPTHQLFELLRKNNYVIFNKEPNILSRATLFEYAF